MRSTTDRAHEVQTDSAEGEPVHADSAEGEPVHGEHSADLNFRNWSTSSSLNTPCYLLLWPSATATVMHIEKK